MFRSGLSRRNAARARRSSANSGSARRSGSYGGGAGGAVNGSLIPLRISDNVMCIRSGLGVITACVRMGGRRRQDTAPLGAAAMAHNRRRPFRQRRPSAPVAAEGVHSGWRARHPVSGRRNREDNHRPAARDLRRRWDPRLLRHPDPATWSRHLHSLRGQEVGRIRRLVEARISDERAAFDVAQCGALVPAPKTKTPIYNLNLTVMRQAEETIRMLEAELCIAVARRKRAGKVFRRRRVPLARDAYLSRPSDAYLRPINGGKR